MRRDPDIGPAWRALSGISLGITAGLIAKYHLSPYVFDQHYTERPCCRYGGNECQDDRFGVQDDSKLEVSSGMSGVIAQDWWGRGCGGRRSEETSVGLNLSQRSENFSLLKVSFSASWGLRWTILYPSKYIAR